MTSSSPSPARWPRAVAVLHWLAALAVLVGVTAVLGRGEIESRPWRALWLSVHRHAGLLVLALLVLRLVTRLLRPGRPPVPGGLGTRLAAAAMHLALYVLLAAVPLFGWALSDASGSAWQAFGLTWPALTGADPDRADDLSDWHSLAAWIFIALIGLHAAAALWHHWVRRDGVLKAMGWPAGRTRPHSIQREETTG